MSYDAARDTAVRLLTARGTSATVTQVAVTTIDTDTDTPSVATLTMGVTVVILPASGTQADTREAQTRIRQRFRTVYFATPAALTFMPKSGDTINWGDGAFALSGVSPLAPDGGVPVLFTASVEVS